MENDPLHEVRSIRRKISQQCNDDPQKVFEYYLKHQEESKKSGKYQFVNRPLATTHAAASTVQTEKLESQ
jgi:hypothetical protein